MMSSPFPSARLLDITRLLRRAGRVPTGVDRVELAYLRELLALDTPVYGLARTRLGYVLLDRVGLRDFEARVSGKTPWGATDRLSGVLRHMPDSQKRAESDIRRLAIARGLPPRLGKMVRQHIPRGAAYVNVGHSNLTGRVLSVLKHQADMRIAVMVHDTIPLDFPQYQRTDTAPKFREMLRRVRAMADLVICNSEQTRADVTRHMRDWGDVPQCVVAHLGVEVATPTTLPDVMEFDPDHAYFVTVGTIEPRKNHAFLLDIWGDLGAQGICPQLVICGNRGWRNEEVFARLESDPLMGSKVFECPDLSDGQIAALMQRSNGMLFPSVVEGYGLPPIEAAAMGVPVICNDLPVYREILGNIPVYVRIEDRYLWAHKIKGLMQPQGAGGQAAATTGFRPPTWQSHFNAVLRLT